MTFDISVIITAHHEGRLVHKTMKSIFNALEYAKSHGITSQIIVVLDKSDEETLKYFSRYYNSEITVTTVDYGDPGLSRNHGVSIASGKYIALLDGDDLFTEQWLVKAYNEAEKHNEDIVWYPEYVISFGCNDMIAKYRGTGESTFNISDLIEHNCWNSVHFMTKKEVLLTYPFEQTQLSLGFGYEDWHWYCEIIAQGIEIRIVPETLICYRKKNEGSRLSQFIQMMVLMPPSKLFEVDTFSKYVSERQVNVNEESPQKIASVQRTWLKRLKRFVDLTYFALSPVVTPFFQKYPNIHQLARQIAGITLNNIPVRKFPEWLLTEWKNIHEIEPQLYPEQWIIETIPYYQVPASRLGLDYISLCRQYIDPPSHLFILPWILQGGADLESLNYIHALAKDSLAKQITVITTENTDSPWAVRLPEGVRFIEFGKHYSHLTAHEQEILLTRALIQMPPQVMHNVNSPLCYRIFIKYARALRNRSRLFVSTFCKDVSEDGQAVGYPFMYLPVCFDDLEAVFCDNKSFIDHLCDIYAFEKEKLHVHYQPFTITERKKYYDKVSEKKTLDILWAGRMDRQKRPDILAAIAEACKDMPFHFHVYGAALLDRDIYSGRMKDLKNITLYGLFDGLQSLPVELYDLFLYTSQWDGLPNVLLEAISVGLPIVASNVGGVSELIVSGETGYLIEPYDDVNAYVQCLRDIYKDRSLLPLLVDNAYEVISAKHSWEGFLSNIKNCPGYIAN